jgi:hypothetical protein
MKDSSPLWVSMIEAVAIVARLTGKRLLEAWAKLIEAMQLGYVASRGCLDADGISQDIPRADWIVCSAAFRQGWLREPDRRIPRYTNIEIYAADLRQKFGPAEAVETDRMTAASFEVHCESILAALSGAPVKKDAVQSNVREILGTRFRKKIFEDAWRETPGEIKIKRGKPSKPPRENHPK